MERLDNLLTYLYALDGKGIRLGLERVKKLYDFIGNPEKRLRIIHIAGTNGKGSTGSFIASILREAGYRVGLFTSPHLIRFNERIRVDDFCISDEEIVEYVGKVRDFVDRIDATFFETTTAMALDYFSRKDVDYCILETGLGGRLDATNAVVPVISVITPIGKDHTERLGKTLSMIAGEKAGIIKTEIPVIVSRQKKVVMDVLEETANKVKARLLRAENLVKTRLLAMNPGEMRLKVSLPDGTDLRMTSYLSGYYQKENIPTAIATCLTLEDPLVNFRAISGGIRRTFWPGRMQVMCREPLVIYDVGHNSHGLRQVFRTLEKYNRKGNLHLLLALHKNKDISTIVKLAKGLFQSVTLSEIPSDNSMSVERMNEVFSRYFSKSQIKMERDFSSALQHIMSYIHSEDTLLIAGSHYFAHIVYEEFDFSLDSYLKFN